MEKLLWMDLEMTGLNPETEVIIEVASIVTDLNFSELQTYHAVVKQPQKYLDAMDDWNRRTHGESGLIQKIPAGLDPAVVESQLVAVIEKHFPVERPVLAGNSIGQDRSFIDRHWKNLSAKLHYRMLDVTSWKIIMREKYKVDFKKQNHHQALEDIRESIAELKHYLSYVDPRQQVGQSPP